MPAQSPMPGWSASVRRQSNLLVALMQSVNFSLPDQIARGSCGQADLCFDSVVFPRVFDLDLTLRARHRRCDVLECTKMRLNRDGLESGRLGTNARYDRQ